MIVGLERLSKSIIEGNDFDDFFTIHQKNLTSILFSVNCVEAKINELISVYEIDDRTSLHDKIKVIIEIEKKVNIIEKFNLVCALLNKEGWESSKEPYQSFELIQTLRNEIVHFKGKYEENGTYPKKLRNLFQKIDCSVSEEDIWLKCVLGNKNIAQWILEVTRKIINIIDNKIKKTSPNKPAKPQAGAVG